MTDQGARLRLGSRGSPLALAMTQEVKQLLAAAHPELAEPDAISIIVVRTTGDAIRDKPLYDVGGKGLFTKEIDEALVAGVIDVAVHSMKDVPTWLAPGVRFMAMLEREDPRDALVVDHARLGNVTCLADLPKGALLGTSAMRRQAQVLHRRPDMRVQSLRGNVDSRLRKLKSGEMDATLLALAGLKRLNLAHEASCILDPAEMLPAASQGVTGVAIRENDERAARYVAALDHGLTRLTTTAERGMLNALDGSCRTPIGAFAQVQGDRIRLDGLVALPDGSGVFTADGTGALGDARRLGEEVGERLKVLAGPTYFAALA